MILHWERGLQKKHSHLLTPFLAKPFLICGANRIDRKNICKTNVIAAGITLCKAKVISNLTLGAQKFIHVLHHPLVKSSKGYFNCKIFKQAHHAVIVVLEILNIEQFIFYRRHVYLLVLCINFMLCFLKSELKSLACNAYHPIIAEYDLFILSGTIFKSGLFIFTIKV